MQTSDSPPLFNRDSFIIATNELNMTLYTSLIKLQLCVNEYVCVLDFDDANALATLFQALFSKLNYSVF